MKYARPTNAVDHLVWINTIHKEDVVNVRHVFEKDRWETNTYTAKNRDDKSDHLYFHSTNMCHTEQNLRASKSSQEIKKEIRENRILGIKW